MFRNRIPRLEANLGSRPVALPQRSASVGRVALIDLGDGGRGTNRSQRTTGAPANQVACWSSSGRSNAAQLRGNHASHSLELAPFERDPETGTGLGKPAGRRPDRLLHSQRVETSALSSAEPRQETTRL